ncbi:hypothetical protein C2G38_438024 [Gigaspora rosea]|uniref:Uncharacterized protein n=1 Tax=Gigaspora rosea TaxID=44941 RepID=A0A397VSU7_9GLOM|nr:hypothetical protein C2G38_438024 [Gigaspora rosea]
MIKTVISFMGLQILLKDGFDQLCYMQYILLYILYAIKSDKHHTPVKPMNLYMHYFRYFFFFFFFQNKKKFIIFFFFFKKKKTRF